MLRDLRLAVRQLVRQPALAGVAVLSVAIGIGLNATLFSVVNAVLFRGIPLADPERLRTELSVVQMRGFAIRIGERSPGFTTTPLSLGNAAQHPLAPLA